MITRRIIHALDEDAIDQPRGAQCNTALAKAQATALNGVMQAISRQKDPFSGSPPAPDSPFVAIGDVHGRRDLLEPLLHRAKAVHLPVVLLGDYVDHGPDSAGVLRLLQDSASQMQLTCLRGNHEDLMTRFVNRPRRTGKIWLRFGGRATLQSYGITDIPEDHDPDALVRARDALLAAMGDTFNWLKSMPYWWQSGNVAALHAGADPSLPLTCQTAKAMAWGHPDFGRVPRNDGIWCIHGHRIVRRLSISDGVISIDTGAWKTNRLCAVVVGDGPVRKL